MRVAKLQEQKQTGTGVGMEIPIEISFVEKETATEWLKKALHRIIMMIEEKVLKCKKWNISFFCNPALSLSLPLKKWVRPSDISSIVSEVNKTVFFSS